MHTLDRLAQRFNAAGVPLMALKGAALQVALGLPPRQRPMCDLDILVKPADLAAARGILAEFGAAQSQVLLRDDFFPRFYYEIEYTVGQLRPIVIDLHVRPWRPLRYARFMPDDAFFEKATPVAIGRGTVHLPSHEDMLLHLAVHWAVHGCRPGKWRQDLETWIVARDGDCQWERLLQAAVRWRLVWPLRKALDAVDPAVRTASIPHDFRAALRDAGANWRDRLALWHAPRDDDHPVGHVAVSALTTPGVGHVLGYLRASLLPDEAHMRQWYPHDHRCWLGVSRLVRCLGPVGRALLAAAGWRRVWRLEPVEAGRWQLVAARPLMPGQLIARLTAGAVAGSTGILRHVSHDARPTARIESDRLVAIHHLKRGEAIMLAAMDPDPAPPHALDVPPARHAGNAGPVARCREESLAA